MTEQKFRSEMRRAQTMQRREDSEPMEAEYWAGYQRGLRRAFHGEKFGTAEENALWPSLSDRRDERSKQRGRGYRDGIAFAEISGQIGRPRVGDECLEKITVPTELREAMEKRSEELGISMPDARRRAYEGFVKAG